MSRQYDGVLKALCELTREVERLQQVALDGAVMVADIDPAWVNWDVLHTDIKFVAFDYDGELWGYFGNPTISQGDRLWNGERSMRIDRCINKDQYRRGGFPWNEIKLARP